MLETRIKTKKTTSCIRISSITMDAKLNPQKRTEADKNGEKAGKALWKLMNNAVYAKTMENFRNKIDARIVSNKKDYLKWTSKPSNMSQKILHNDLFEKRKSKVTLTFNKPVYVGMYILDLSKVLIYFVWF